MTRYGHSTLPATLATPPPTTAEVHTAQADVQAGTHRGRNTRTGRPALSRHLILKVFPVSASTATSAHVI